jgi:hypothetical protein
MLAGALERVRGPRRLAASVRRCVPAGVDPERLRALAQAWWDAGAAAPLRVEDAALAHEVVAPATSRLPGGDTPPRVVVHGPWHAHRTLEALEPRLVHESLTLAAAGPPGDPLLVACVADPCWPMYAVRDGGGGLRDLLYGPAREVGTDHGVQTWRFDGTPAAALFRDRALGDVAGVMFLDRVSATRARVRAHLNPWGRAPLAARDLAPCVAAFRSAEGRSDSDRDNVSLRWYEAPDPELEL